MFAIIKTGGKQYKIKENDTIFVEKLKNKKKKKKKLFFLKKTEQKITKKKNGHRQNITVLKILKIGSKSIKKK